MKRISSAIALFALAGFGTAAEADAPVAAALSGGDFTVFDITSRAYGQHGPNLPIRDLGTFSSGNRLFNTNWVIAPASVRSLDGLGPVFNRVSCSACHTRDGRGVAPDSPIDPLESMLVRLSVPGAPPTEAPTPHPVYGNQLNERAIPGVSPEGRASIQWQEIRGTYPDDSTFTLRKPQLRIVDLAYGELGPDTMLSLRISPAVFGLGLLEAIPAETLLNLADPDDANGDGISGRPNYVSNVRTGERVIGRFGWKANAPDILQQVAAAALGDIGLTSSMFPEHGLSESHVAARNAPAGGDDTGVELSDAQLDKLTFYLRSLAVPARRDIDDPAVQRGEFLFDQAGCSACHLPRVQTGSHPDMPILSHQTIQPFTDLLLHDLGPDLADHRPDFAATGSEWRTPPLWGLGLTEIVRLNGPRPEDQPENLALLHDGRARTFEEAILWHGGEAAASRDAFKQMPAADRHAVVRFLQSL